MKNKWDFKEDVLCPKIPTHQVYIPEDYYIVKKIKTISNNTHNLYDGDYLYIILKEDPSEVRMLPVKFVVDTGGGHSSYIDNKNYKEQYEKKNCDLLYAGWISIENGGFKEWTNNSGHYLPKVKNSIKTGLDLKKFREHYFDDTMRKYF